ncbi:MAG: hypothetical protein CVV41_17260 [Candidatus Riflebacteria bacterium HGW-Riflebacteria-1]|jgi:hypothetical protein|nr:MAG: hypothetical protein CVV41_17260 [Candidatus Riflebacteria bacterium HGW-Riflebacteria-1]
MQLIKQFRFLLFMLILLISSSSSVFARDLVQEAEAILQSRQDVVESVEKSFGQLKTPFDILEKWLQFTDEKSEFVNKARSVLNDLTPEFILALRPDIRQSVKDSTGVTQPLEVLQTWLKWNKTEDSSFVTMAEYAVRKSSSTSSENDSDDQEVDVDTVEDIPESPVNEEEQSEAGASVIGLEQMFNSFAIKDLPRPAKDSGWGIHWFPTLGSSKEVVDKYLAECEKMGIRWIVFLNVAEQISEANDYLIDEMKKKNMMPVLRLYSLTVPLDWEKVAQVVRHNVKKGVFYFQIYNEPNLKCEWPNGVIDLPAFVDLWLQGAKVILDAGGFPAFAPLCGAGEDGRSDLEFLNACLDLLEQKSELKILESCWISIHNQTWQPVDYVEDANGFKKFQFYNRIISKRLGQSRPIIATEGGFQTGGNKQMYDRHMRYNIDYYNYMLKAEPYYFAQCNWIIGNDVGGGDKGMWEDATWFTPDGPLPIVAALKKMEKKPRAR